MLGDISSCTCQPKEPIHKMLWSLMLASIDYKKNGLANKRFHRFHNQELKSWN